jgi:hypothetical protein
MDSVALICERGRFSPDCGTLLVILRGPGACVDGVETELVRRGDVLWSGGGGGGGRIYAWPEERRRRSGRNERPLSCLNLPINGSHLRHAAIVHCSWFVVHVLSEFARVGLGNAASLLVWKLHIAAAGICI